MTDTTKINNLVNVLRQFDIADANLTKLEKLEKDISALIPSTYTFETNPNYEDKCRSYDHILSNLPTIDGWKPTATHMTTNDIVQSRIDAHDIGEVSVMVQVEEDIEKPGVELREYRFRLNQKRKALIRDIISSLIEEIDELITKIDESLEKSEPQNTSMDSKNWSILIDLIGQIDTLLGSSVQRPDRWSFLHRHLNFGMRGDFMDIKQFDWPPIKKFLRENIYEEDEPIPSQVAELSDLVDQKPTGTVTRKLDWSKLSDDEFERLIFTLISNEPGYENPKWLTKTNATDKGRDLSVERILHDSLTGTTRLRVIIQCKHWLSKSISIPDIAALKEQMKLWEPPRVDVHIISTSGRFTTDAVDLIEKNNQSDSALRIEMWPESHLEMLLASRPAIIEEFRLR